MSSNCYTGPNAVIVVHVAEPKWSKDASGGKEKESPSHADALQSPPDFAIQDSLEGVLFPPQKYSESDALFMQLDNFCKIIFLSILVFCLLRSIGKQRCFLKHRSWAGKD